MPSSPPPPRTPPRTRVYCASPSSRAKMWREDLIPSTFGGALHVVSTWHDNETFEANDQAPRACARYWELDFQQIRQSDVLLAYAELRDRPNGTLVEIGYAIAQEIPVYIVGNFEWGTWRYHPSVIHCPTLREAVVTIIGDTNDHTT